MDQTQDDSTQRINKIISDINAEIEFNTCLIKGVKTESLKELDGIKYFDGSGNLKFQSAQLKKKMEELEELMSCIDENLLSKEIYIWKNLMLYCCSYDTMSFLDHECSMECCSPIKSLSTDQKFSKKKRDDETTTRRILDIFYNEKDREFFQKIVILNYTKGYLITDQSDFRHYSISLSNIHKLYGCFPSGRLHMCHPVASKRYETCSKTASVCQNTGKVFCALSGLIIPGHWEENDMDSSLMTYSDDIHDMSYVTSVKTNVNSNNPHTSQYYTKTYDSYSDLISKIDYGLSGSHSNHPYTDKQQLIPNSTQTQQKRKIDGKNISLDMKTVGQYLVGRTSEILDQSSDLKDVNHLHFSTVKIPNSSNSTDVYYREFKKDSHGTGASIQDSDLPTPIKKMLLRDQQDKHHSAKPIIKKMDYSQSILNRQLSKDSKHEITKIKREFSTKTPSKKILGRKYGQYMRKQTKMDDENIDFDIFRGNMSKYDEEKDFSHIKQPKGDEEGN